MRNSAAAGITAGAARINVCAPIGATRARLQKYTSASTNTAPQSGTVARGLIGQCLRTAGEANEHPGVGLRWIVARTAGLRPIVGCGPDAKPDRAPVRQQKACTDMTAAR